MISPGGDDAPFARVRFPGERARLDDRPDARRHAAGRRDVHRRGLLQSAVRAAGPDHAIANHRGGQRGRRAVRAGPERVAARRPGHDRDRPVQHHHLLRGAGVRRSGRRAGANRGGRASLANTPPFNLATSFEQISGIRDLPTADPIETGPVVSDVALLILTGAFAPATPASGGELAVETPPNGCVIEIPGVSHDPATLAGPAGVQLILDFLADPTRRPDTSAIEQNQVDFSPEG